MKLVHVFHKSRLKRSTGEKVIHIQIDGEESEYCKSFIAIFYSNAWRSVFLTLKGGLWALFAYKPTR